MDINEVIKSENPELWKAMITGNFNLIDLIAEHNFPIEADRLTLLLGKYFSPFDKATENKLRHELYLRVSQHIGHLLRVTYGGIKNDTEKLFTAIDGYVYWTACLIASGVDITQSSLMIYAVQYDDSEIIKMLIAAGASLNIEWMSTTPLIHGIWSKNTVAALLAGGADANQTTNDGNTALKALYNPAIKHLSESDQIEIERMLRNAGAHS